MLNLLLAEKVFIQKEFKLLNLWEEYKNLMHITQ